MTAPDLEPLPLPTPVSFHYEERDSVGIITLDRPDRFNALTFAVYRELTDLFAVIDRRALVPGGARALVLRGRGRAFCSGGDIIAPHALKVICSATYPASARGENEERHCWQMDGGGCFGGHWRHCCSNLVGPI